MLAEFSSANRKALSRPNRIEDGRAQSERPEWLQPVVHISPSAAVLPRDPSVAVVSDSCRGGSATSRTADLPPGRRGHRDRIEIVRGPEVTQVANRSGKKSLDLVDSKGRIFGEHEGEKRKLPECRTRRQQFYESRPTPRRVSRCLAGTVKQNLAPRGWLSAAHKRPWCASMMERLIRSPMPVPCVLVVKKAVKILSACCGGSPTPLSLTDIST